MSFFAYRKSIAAPGGASSPQITPKRILILSDYPRLSRVVHRLLTDRYQVEERFIPIWQSRCYPGGMESTDLIVVMLVSASIQAIKETFLPPKPAYPPILWMLEDNLETIQALPEGINLLAYPFLPEELLKKVQNLLDAPPTP